MMLLLRKRQLENSGLQQSSGAQSASNISNYLISSLNFQQCHNMYPQKHQLSYLAMVSLSSKGSLLQRNKGGSEQKHATNTSG